jgi:Zn-dependent protease with chaperone function
MMSEYWLRLVCLALASYFWIHLAAASAVALASPGAVRFSTRLAPRFAARFLFALRLLPAVVSLGIVTAVCIPSYLLFEPEAAGEQIGLACIAAAVLALLHVCASFVLALYSGLESMRCLRQWRRDSRLERLAGSGALVIDGEAPFLALAGFFHPRLIATRGLLRTLSAEQLEAAVQHEHAHRDSRDNWKRLILRCTPGLFPFVSGFAALDQAWAKQAELAADDRSTAGDPRRALLLADALVLVAGSCVQREPTPFVIPLLAAAAELRDRVERLLEPAQSPQASFARWPYALAATCAILAALLPFTLSFVHELLERLLQ